MPTHNLIQNPELIRRLAEGLGVRQAHVTPALNEGVQAVVLLDDLRGAGQLVDADAKRFSLYSNMDRGASTDGHNPCWQLRNPVDSRTVARVRRVSLRLINPNNEGLTQLIALGSYVNSGTTAAAGLIGVGRGLLDDPGAGGIANGSRRGFGFNAAGGGARRAGSTCLIDKGGVTNNDDQVEPEPYGWAMLNDLFAHQAAPDPSPGDTVSYGKPFMLDISWGEPNGVAQGPVLSPGDTFAIWVPFAATSLTWSQWEWEEFTATLGGV